MRTPGTHCQKRTKDSYEYIIVAKRGLEISDGDNRDSPVILHVSVVEVKFQFVGVAEIVLHHYNEVVRLLTIRRVVQPELLVFEQVAVIGQEM